MREFLESFLALFAPQPDYVPTVCERMFPSTFFLAVVSTTVLLVIFCRMCWQAYKETQV